MGIREPEKKSEKIRLQKNAQNQRGGTRSALYINPAVILHF